MNKRETPDNTVFWKKYAPVFETHKAQDPQPIWFFKDFLFKDFPDGGTIVDIGCGSGRGMSAIQKLLGYFPIGVDVSEAALQQAKQRGIPSEKLILADILKAPLPTTYEAIWVSDLLLYFDLKQELDDVMKKIRAGLKKNGRLGFRWSVGNDDLMIKNQNSKFLASETFIRNLLTRHSFHLVFIQQKEEPVYVADNIQRNGRSIFSRFWYVLATPIQDVIARSTKCDEAISMGLPRRPSASSQ